MKSSRSSTIVCKNCGKKSDFTKSQIQYFNTINKLNLSNPTIIGFGISDKKSFQNACKYSNGAIIGTKFIQSIPKSIPNNNLRKNIEKYIFSIR